MKLTSIQQTNLDLPGVTLFKRGKVRDVYGLKEHLLIVSTDRLSAFDVIMKEPIPNKGKMLTELSSFWFTYLKDVVPNHFVTTDIFSYYPILKSAEEELSGRSMLVKKADVIPYECIVRGYLMGSAYREYQEKGTICGDSMPAGLQKGEAFSSPLFTPSTKAETGHDENISFHTMREQLGEVADDIKHYSLALFQKARDYALSKGIIIADTKFEFGLFDSQVIVIDELFTPDSSRFILQEDFEQGHFERSMDKEFIRAWLANTSWNKEPPPPAIPEEVLIKTQQRYQEITDKITR